VGAFSPFSRDHNTYDAPPQELYRWDSVAEAGRNALGLRYRMLPHLYTLMYEAHTLGNVVHCPLWMKFPRDAVTLTRTDGQFMWGSSVLFTPVLEQGAVKVTGYFPQGKWYSLFDSTVQVGGYVDASAGGVWVELQTPLTATNAHLRGGHIVPMQEYGMTTDAVHASGFNIVVGVDINNRHSHGSLFYDDGEQLYLDEYVSVVYGYQDSIRTFESVVMNASYHLPTAQLLSVEIWGAAVPLANTSCSAFMTMTNNVKLAASSVTLANSTTFAKVIISFDTGIAVNIGTSFDLKWDCVRPAEDTKNKNSNDDESGWSSIPSYGQALIIVSASLVGVLAIGIVGYFIVNGSRKKDPLMDNQI
jgi:hypothetical protein